MELATLTRPELIFPDLPGGDRSSALLALAERMVEEGVVSDTQQLHAKLLERERLCSTGVGDGVAIPHCKIKKLDQVVVAIGVLAQPIEFGASDGKPVRLLFLVLSPEKSPAAHLQSLAAISKWIQADARVEKILEHPDREAIFALLEESASTTEAGVR